MVIFLTLIQLAELQGCFDKSILILRFFVMLKFLNKLPKLFKYFDIGITV